MLVAAACCHHISAVHLHCVWLAAQALSRSREEHPIPTAFAGDQPALLWPWWVDEEELLHCCMHTELNRTSNKCLSVEIP